MSQLATVAGNVDLTGNFNDVSLPAISDVGGGVNVESTSSSFQCPSNIHGVTKGSAFTCEGNVQHPVPGQGLKYSNSHPNSAKKNEWSKPSLRIRLIVIDLEVILTALIFGVLMQLIW